MTLYQLKRRGWYISNRCYLGKEEEETTNHLPLLCDKVRMLWNLIFSLSGVQWVMHFPIRKNLLGWHGSFVDKKMNKAWRATPLCLMRTTWKERNDRPFNDIEWSNQAIKFLFMYIVVNWARVHIEDHTFFFISKKEVY